MSKKNVLLLAACFLAVAGFYFYLYKDSFGKPVIQISHTIRPKGWSPRRRITPASPDQEATDVVTFRLGGEYKLTSIKVISIPELTTNKYAEPVWELASDSNSVPTQAFSYGLRIRGMHPRVKGQQPVPLAPNTPYRLFVQAGYLRGEHDFTIKEDTIASQ
jgi:hypothetical protein